ncbi:hypothetical protein QBC36DRAFT_389551 [Triangularia setosa]|uniref:Aminoglycoside phosphotransferase domain-containing protein n=1 Tax=Triangularia setosa TaxID=2587417 RepID=A0AAN6W1F6_9PEZI|nr:hypothetical protein QBC36DRAFT_389551 [Podospora setosa]
MADQDVVPDDSLLGQIFANSPASFKIILHDWDKCIFAATVPNSLRYGQNSCLVRLEAINDDASRVTMVAAMQEIAAAHVSGLVPETLQIDKAINEQGGEFQFSVMDLVEGNTLEEVWDQIIVDALSKLQSGRLADIKVQAILRRALSEGNGKDHSLLSSVEKMWQWRQPFYTIRSLDNPQGIVIESNLKDLGSVTVSHSDMNQWSLETTFCHNDVTPRNMIIRLTESPGGNKGLKLAGIVDWELTGFYPPSYQLSIQDTYPGCSHRHLSFYILFQEADEGCRSSLTSASHPFARHGAHIRVLRTLSAGRNIGAHVKKIFWDMLKLSRDTHPYIGWKPDVEGALPGLSKKDFQKLENDGIADIFEKQ